MMMCECVNERVCGCTHLAHTNSRLRRGGLEPRPSPRLQTVDEMDRGCASPVGRALALGRPASRLELLREEYQQTLAAVRARCC